MNLELLISYSLLFSILFLVSGTGFSAPAIALVCEIVAWKKDRKFWDKFALQIARLGLICSIIFLLLISTALILDHYYWQLLTKPLRSLSLPHLIMPLSLFILGLLFLITYWGTWKKLKKKKIAHLLIGLASTLSLGATFYLLQKTSFKLLTAEPFALLNSIFWFHWIKTFLAPVSPFFWPLFTQSILIILGSVGISGLIYLLLRREKDLFGRDYYRWAVPFAARWSFIFPLNVLCYLWIYLLSPAEFKLLFLSSRFSLSCGIGLILSLFCTLIWSTILRNSNPLRLKGRIIGSAFLIWTALASFALSTYLGLWPWLL